MASCCPSLREVVIAAIFCAASIRPHAQQDISNLDRVRALDLDSLVAGYRVYYSDGYEDRAAQMGRLVAASNEFFRSSLGVDVDVAIALLDTVDYERAAFDGPYGLPFVRDGVVVQPADVSVGVVRDAYAPYERTASTVLVAQLASAGLSYSDALPVMFDAIALHEIGHVQVGAYGLDTKQRWFNEFMATYFGYAFMRSGEPAMALVWDAITSAGREGYEPTYTSLDDLNRLYGGVGGGNYVWYQNVFQDRVRVVHDLYGLDFIRRAKARLSDTDWEPETAAELLAALDEIAPGFAAWAEAYEE